MGSPSKKLIGVFDPEGSDYDYDTALKWGMGPNGKGENAGHWGSVAPTTDEERAKYKLADESYKILKGRNHETFHKAVAGETARGFKVEKFGDRYFSIPDPSASPSSKSVQQW